MESLPSPFGDPAPNLSDSELRETAYEILVADCRSTGSRPLTYIPQSNRSNAGATAGLSPSPSLHRSLTSTAASKVKKALGMKKKNGGEESSSQSDRGKKFATVGELIRIQMRISEQIDSRIRRALLRIASGQLGRHPEKMVLPLELLQQLKATDFPDQEEYVSWQRRNLKLLEAGLILYPCVSLSKSDKSVQQLKQIIRSGLEKPLDTGKITGETQNLRSLVMSLASAAEEATAVFGETAALSIQKQYMQQLSTSLGLNTYNEERNSTSTKNTSSEDYIARDSLKIHKAMALQISLEISILMVLMVVFQICHFIIRLLQ